jgi:rod shape-determining protein MreC
LYLPSKIKLKHLILVCSLGALAILPFKGIIRYIFLGASSNQLRLGESSYKEEIQKLTKEKLLLIIQLKEYQALEKENQRLRKVLELTTSEEITLLGADIIAFSPTTWRHFATLNKGKTAGVRKGYYAIDEKGNLLGKVVEVEENTSEIIFVDDPDFNASVFVGNHGYGLLKGNLVGAKLLYIEDGERIAKDDRVWMRIPSLKSEIGIGTIKKVKKDQNSLFWDIDVNLLTTNSFFDRVYLVQ